MLHWHLSPREFSKAWSLKLRVRPLGWPESGSVIQDLSGLWCIRRTGESIWPEWIRRFLWCTIIQTDLGSLILIQITPKEITYPYFWQFKGGRILERGRLKGTGCIFLFEHYAWECDKRQILWLKTRCNKRDSNSHNDQYYVQMGKHRSWFVCLIGPASISMPVIIIFAIRALTGRGTPIKNCTLGEEVLIWKGGATSNHDHYGSLYLAIFKRWHRL